jgi:hypothetical protein
MLVNADSRYSFGDGDDLITPDTAAVSLQSSIKVWVCFLHLIGRASALNGDSRFITRLMSIRSYIGSAAHFSLKFVANDMLIIISSCNYKTSITYASIQYCTSRPRKSRRQRIHTLRASPQVPYNTHTLSRDALRTNKHPIPYIHREQCGKINE